MLSACGADRERVVSQYNGGKLGWWGRVDRMIPVRAPHIPLHVYNETPQEPLEATAMTHEDKGQTCLFRTGSTVKPHCLCNRLFPKQSLLTATRVIGRGGRTRTGA